MKSRLKEIRMKEYLMTGKEFAEMLNLKHTTYYNWEKGVSQPPLEIAFKIALKLNKSIYDIWYLEK